jgi:DNA-binding MarR family transcriptional regulator
VQLQGFFILKINLQITCIYIYICLVKLEIAIHSTKFKSEVHKAGLNILYTAWWLKTLGCKELKEFGLTHEQYNVLRILKGKHPEQMCVKDIAGRMIEKNSNVPRIIDRLAAKKLVKRSQGAEDARQTVMSLTETGLNILESSTKKMDEIFDESISLNETEAARLNDLLETLRDIE